MKAVLFDVKKNDASVIDLPDECDLETLYTKLDCKTIDIVDRFFNGTNYSVILDDEGLFKQDNIPSIFTTGTDEGVVETIVGNVIVCKYNDNGGMISLSDKDISTIMGCVFSVGDKKFLHASI